jgi:hypothetical protein
MIVGYSLHNDINKFQNHDDFENIANPNHIAQWFYRYIHTKDQKGKQIDLGL